MGISSMRTPATSLMLIIVQIVFYRSSHSQNFLIYSKRDMFTGDADFVYQRLLSETGNKRSQKRGYIGGHRAAHAIAKSLFKTNF